MPQMTQMHPDLMGTPGFQAKVHPTVVPLGRQHLPMGHCRSPGRNHRHFLPLLGMPSDGSVDRAGDVGQSPVNQTQVFPSHAPSLDLLLQMLLRPSGFGHHHHPGCVLIQTMDNARTLFVRHRQEIGTVGQQGIDQRTVPMTGRWMHHQPRRFVEDQQLLIFIENVQGNGLGRRVQRLRVGNLELHPIPGA
jgi:hypothetical protein